MFASEENKLKIIIAGILAISLAIIFIFNRVVLENRFEQESQQLLYQIGKNYEYDIKSELSRFSSLSDLLARSIANNNENPEFHKNIGNVFRDLIYRNSRLQSIDLVLQESEIKSDSLNLLINIDDSLKKKSIRIVKTKSGIIEETEIKEFDNKKFKVSIEKAIITDQTKILDPEIIQIEENPTTIIPVLSTIYKGKEFIGYIILYVSSDLMLQPNIDQQEILGFTEIFVSSPEGKVINLNTNKELLAEPIDKICISCKDILGNKGQDFNIDNQNNYLTVCVPWQPAIEAEYWNICLRAPLNKISKVLNYHNSYSWLVLFILLLLAIFSVIIVLNRYTRIWTRLNNHIRELINGEASISDLEEEFENKGKSSELKSSVVKIAKSLDGLVQLNKTAIKGDTDEQIEPELPKHQAFVSTMKMHQHYKSTIDKLENENFNLKQVKELTDGLDKINAVLKLYHTDLQKLSIYVIHTLVDLLEIEMGAVFLVKTGENEQHLEMMVSYAYSEDRFQKRSFSFGESLVGACAAEKRTIFIKKVPEDYLKIISGLGLASPKSILIVPLVFEGSVLGVIELGSLKDFDERKIDFTERAAETIANTLSLAEINIKTSVLLEKTQQQTIELENRDKKMFEALNELKQLQIKTANSETAMRARIEAMNNTLMMVEYTSKGFLLDANFKYLNTMNYTLEEIKGIDVLELLKEEDRPELIKIINIVRNGNYYESVMRRHTRQGVEKWLMATYTPVYNEQNVVESILFFAIDLTRVKKNEEKLKQQIKTLMAQVEDLRSELKHDKA